MNFDGYDPGEHYDEMFAARCAPRPGAALVSAKLASLGAGELLRRQHAAERALLTMGITFNVYGHASGAEKIMPFDIVPRIVDAATWDVPERGG